MVLVVPAERDGVEHVGRFGRIHRVAAPRSPAFDRRYRVILPHRFLSRGRGGLRDLVASERPDIVEVADKYSLCYFAGLLRRERRRTGIGPTLIGSSCERLDDNLRAFVTRHPAASMAARRFLGGVYIGMFDAHVANSQYTAAELERSMRHPHVRPVYVSPPGVHPVNVVLPFLRAAGRQSLKATFGIPTTAVCLVYAGRLSPEKNVSILPDMMARLLAVVPDAHLLLIGEGPERMRVAHSAAVSAPDRVHFHPHVVDRGALCELTAGADIFVHPNPREPFGIGPLEAMALGVPVVLPAAGGVLTYATDANAWLAVPGAEGLAAAVMRAVVNPAERRRRVDAARHTAARFAWPLAAERLLALHRAIHAERLAGAPQSAAGRARRSTELTADATAGLLCRGGVVRVPASAGNPNDRV